MPRLPHLWIVGLDVVEYSATNQILWLIHPLHMPTNSVDTGFIGASVKYSQCDSQSLIKLAKMTE